MNDKEESHSNWPKQTTVTSTGDILGHNVSHSAHNSGFMTFGSTNVVNTYDNFENMNQYSNQNEVEKKIGTIAAVTRFLSASELDMVISYMQEVIENRKTKHAEKKKVNKRKLNL